MPDLMERCQEFNADHVRDALDRHQSRPRLPARTTCANLDCGELITPERQVLHAQLCLPCQRLEEASPGRGR